MGKKTKQFHKHFIHYRIFTQNTYIKNLFFQNVFIFILNFIVLFKSRGSILKTFLSFARYFHNLAKTFYEQNIEVSRIFSILNTRPYQDNILRQTPDTSQTILI